MDYCCYDELIIMSPFATLKKVTVGHQGTDLCFLKALIKEYDQVKCDPAVIRRAHSTTARGASR